VFRPSSTGTCMKADVFIASGQPVRSAGTKGLTVFFLLLSCILAILCVSTRNIYDDEHTSLGYVNRSVSEIIQIANSGNVHPPGMYLLAHFAFRAISVKSKGTAGLYVF
jgi:hypothetical protein